MGFQVSLDSLPGLAPDHETAAQAFYPVPGHPRAVPTLSEQKLAENFFSDP